MAYTRNPRKRIIRGSSSDELRRGGRRTSEEFDAGGDMPFVRLGSSAIGTQQDVVQRIGDAIIGGDFGGNARGEGALDIQVTRFSGYSGDEEAGEPLVGIVDPTYVASGVSSVAFGRDSRAVGEQAVAMGYANIADGTYSVAIGAGNEVSVGLAVAVGAFNSVSVANEGVALGYANIVKGFRAVAVGRTARVDYDYGVAVGNNATARERAVAVGPTTSAYGLRGVAVGESAYVDALAENGIAIGKQAESRVADQAVIAATTFKMQTSWLPNVLESVITTSDAAPVTGNLASWADVDRIDDAGVVVSDVALKSLTLAQFAATTSAQLAGALSDETGYSAGAVAVFSISPVFGTNISTPAIVAPAALTVTPAAGSGVAIVLSTTGDFAINTDDFFVDTSTGNVGIGTTALGAKLEVDQASTTAAIPVLLLDQADLSEEFIEFTSTVGAGNPIDTAALGAYYGRVRVNVTGVGYKYIGLYDA